ncbi:hypothetical protein KUTeg_009786 [Tegillarca granosa]|uniref:Uncharacterized protein n=1 Tax=Tegillarca granosa TaxID=220873 RepID=A0ABQ9F4W0_TEGGR|nr:hypothetical protein KUTeg_009786 [Tegillarca granosa]
MPENEHEELNDFLNDIPDHSTTDIHFKDDSEIHHEDENGDTPIVMISQVTEGETDVDGDIDGVPREDSLDFSVLQDGNQLDVDIGKQKTSLRKKGSLARRKKPSRNSVRSILNSAEDSHFTDSTEIDSNPRSTSMNGFESDVFGLDQPSDTTDGSHLDINDEDSSQGIPTSPPAKKPSLSIGTALPGLATKPLERRPSRKSTEDVSSKEPETKSNYSSIGVKLPMPDLKETPKKSTEDPSLFDKPVLKSVPKTESEKQSFSTDNTFDTPKLKRVTRSRTASQKSEEGDESSKMFQKPALRNVSSFDKPEKKEVESNKTFVKPSLRTVKHDEQTKSGEPVLERQHTFEKPALRSTPMKQPSFSSNDHSSSSTEEKKPGFDMPALRKTPKPQRKEYSTESDSTKQGSGTFEKPTLKAVSTPSLNRTESQDSDSSAKHTFDKPSLKSVQRPSRSDSNTSDKSGHSSGQPSWLKDMKLRKSKSPERAEKLEQEVSTPSWANTAAEKRSKARDLLDSKENQNKKSSERKALFPDTPQLRKTNGLPLQEDNNRPRRTSSSESDRSEGEKRKYKETSHSGKRDQYVPSWMKVTDSRHKSPSTPNLSSPPESEKMPQWKIDLAERRKNKKDTDTPSEPQKMPDDNAETPSWKLELQKRRKSTPSTPESCHYYSDSMGHGIITLSFIGLGIDTVIF